MVKMRFASAAALAAFLLPLSGAAGAPLGPDAARCAAGDGPAVLVKVVGLKNRVGKVRVRTFNGANSAHWFNKKFAMKRTEVDIPSGGPVEICMSVPKAGAYVLDLRHDMNNNGDSDRADGVGASGNPVISMFDVMFGKKPPAAKVVMQVGNGVTTAVITMKYLSGGSFKPIQTANR
jgi:uncharacterized protein (DUF2141 family)